MGCPITRARLPPTSMLPFEAVASTSEGARMVEQGGVRVDGVAVGDKAARLGAGTHVVQVGKRKFARVTLVAG